MNSVIVAAGAAGAPVLTTLVLLALGLLWLLFTLKLVSKRSTAGVQVDATAIVYALREENTASAMLPTLLLLMLLELAPPLGLYGDRVQQRPFC